MKDKVRYSNSYINSRIYERKKSFKSKARPTFNYVDGAKIAIQEMPKQNFLELKLGDPIFPAIFVKIFAKKF